MAIKKTIGPTIITRIKTNKGEDIIIAIINIRIEIIMIIIEIKTIDTKIREIGITTIVIIVQILTKMINNITNMIIILPTITKIDMIMNSKSTIKENVIIIVDIIEISIKIITIEIMDHNL